MNGTYIDNRVDGAVSGATIDGWNQGIHQICGNGGNGLGHTGSFTSPTIDLSGMASATLEFYAWWEIEAVEASTADFMRVQVQRNGTGAFQTRETLNPTSAPMTMPAVPFTSGGPTQCSGVDCVPYAPNDPVWVLVTVNLNSFAGDQIKIRFFFDSDGSEDAFRGWLVDDVTVTAIPNVAPVANNDPSAGTLDLAVGAHSTSM